MVDRISVEGTLHPNFIGCWKIADPSISDNLIDFFENNKSTQFTGLSGDGILREDIKKTTDISITPTDLNKKEFVVVAEYIKRLKEFYLDYLDQWDFLKTHLPDVHLGPFNLQKYDVGGHFKGLHSERGLGSFHRTHTWMTYLNDVSDGGETEFPMYGLKVKPEKGKTLIWPAEWTHAHSGGVVNKGDKYIITGWMHYPYPNS